MSAARLRKIQSSQSSRDLQGPFYRGFAGKVTDQQQDNEIVRLLFIGMLKKLTIAKEGVVSQYGRCFVPVTVHCATSVSC